MRTQRDDMANSGALLVRANPYRVRPSGIRGHVVTIAPLTLLAVGDLVYEYRMPDGSVLLTRKKLPRS